MATGEEEAKVAETLKAVYLALKKIYDADPGKFLFFNKMKSPVKRIQNKFRYQVLMRITDRSLLPAIYEGALACRTRDVLVYVEEDPASLS